ncbi:hypothetical protein [Nostoc sp.]|uniref:hypothetical protein n=1 Tax=Nostoc sp. TaxID=1180 RepID=UPI002FFC509C
MPIVEQWRRNLWNQRASTKSGIPLERLNQISYSTYFALKNKDIDTIEELLDLVDEIIATGDRLGITQAQLKEIAYALENNGYVHQVNGLRYRYLKNKIGLLLKQQG